MKTPNRISFRRCLTNSNLLRFLGFLVVGLCLTVGTVLGAGKQAAPSLDAREAEEKVVITGSLIPQKVKPNRIPLTTSPVIIIGRQDIDRTGASTVTDLLKRQIGR